MDTGKIEGITIAGNIVADVVKDIEVYPPVGTLSSIQRVTRGVGGSVPNVGIDLARIDPTIPLFGIGCVGKDDNGRFILNELKRHNINIDGIAVLEGADTSFSDVMSLPTGDRTFFHLRGANAVFSPEYIDSGKIRTGILHMAYILLLDRFDAPDPVYGTVMARCLREVQKRGIRTSVDMITSSTADCGRTVIPALRYSDYFIVNENECCAIWEIEPRHADGTLDIDALKRAMCLTLAQGVGEKVIVHAKEVCLCLARGGGFTLMPSLDIPDSFIKGSVGAGDAFCAGALYALYNGMSDREMLSFASAAAAMSLQSENAVDGMRSKAEIEALMQRFPRKKMGWQ